MKLFRRKEKNEQPGKDKLAKGIAGALLRIQNAFAAFMQKHTQKMPVRLLKLFVVIFLVAGFGFSAWCIVDAFFKKEKKHVMIIDHVHLPEHYDQTGDNRSPASSLVSADEYSEMKAFEKYLDSLQHSKKGSVRYNDFIRMHPHLVDSIHQLEAIYQQQSLYKK